MDTDFKQDKIISDLSDLSDLVDSIVDSVEVIKGYLNSAEQDLDKLQIEFDKLFQNKLQINKANFSQYISEFKKLKMLVKYTNDSLEHVQNFSSVADDDLKTFKEKLSGLED